MTTWVICCRLTLMNKFSGSQTPHFHFPFLPRYFCLSFLLSVSRAQTHTEVVSVWSVDRQPLTHMLWLCLWRALTDSVWVCDRGCQRGVREMCLVSHSVDLISGQTVHSGPAVAPYITPAVIHTPAWRDPPGCARTHTCTRTHMQLLSGVHMMYKHPHSYSLSLWIKRPIRCSVNLGGAQSFRSFFPLLSFSLTFA